MVEISIDFSAEELVVLARQIGVAPPSTAGDLSLISDTAAGIAHRALVARRLINAAPGGDGEPILAAARTPESEAREAVRDLAYLICVPEVSVEISRRTETGDDSWFILAQPEAAVEQAEVCAGVFRYTPFRTEEVPGRMQLRADLMDRPAIGGDSVTLACSLLVRLLDALGSGAPDDVLAVCRGMDDGLGVKRLVDALAVRRASVTVSVMHYGSGPTVEGGLVAWADCGDMGLWRLPAPETLASGPPDALVEASPTSKTELLAEIASIFPSGESEPVIT